MNDRTRPFSSRLFSAVLSAGALACTALACGAPATSEPTSVSTTQAISCDSFGLHDETTCGSGGLQPKPAPPPPPAPTPPPLPSPPPASAGCNVNDSCSVAYASVEYPAPGVDDFQDKGWCPADPTVPAALAAAGCMWTMIYTPGGECMSGGANGGQNCPYYATWCPTVPALAATGYPAWTTLPCNTCTGAPPAAGWVLVAYAFEDSSCGAQPGYGCHVQACIQ